MVVGCFVRRLLRPYFSALTALMWGVRRLLAMNFKRLATKKSGCLLHVADGESPPGWQALNLFPGLVQREGAARRGWM